MPETSQDSSPHGYRYAQCGDVSPKVDVYAFGVVLYELISAKEAIVKENGSLMESKGLVGLFEEVLRQPDTKEDLRKLIDPRLGDNYSHDSVRKVNLFPILEKHIDMVFGVAFAYSF